MRSCLASSLFTLLSIASIGCGGGEDDGRNTGGDGGSGSGRDGGGAGGGIDGGGGGGAAQHSELWYSVDDKLVYIPIDTATAEVGSFVISDIEGLEIGQNSLTMLDDGSLLGARLSDSDQQSYFFHIPTPPRDGSAVTPVDIGVMPDGIMVEGLYTDCDGRLYAMDTGVDNNSADGNRLLRFTGDLLGGDFSFVVVSDLSTANVADIDDMSPGITDNEITDNPGLALDTGNLYDFDYESGSGTAAGNGGDWGIHALGGPLFQDGVSRLYVLSRSAELFEMDPETNQLSAALGQGPTGMARFDGWSGLAGPLTDCQSGFEVD